MSKHAITIFLILFYSLPSRASFTHPSDGLDYSVNMTVGYPPTGGLNVWCGYGQVLWGENLPEKILWGYYRPNMRFFTAGVVNRIEVRVDVFPISFFGFTFGVGASHRAVDIPDLDCEQASCRGVLTRVFAENKLKAGYKFGKHLVFLTPTLRWDALAGDNTGMPLADEMTGLRGKSAHDQVMGISAETGIQVSKRIQFGLQAQHQRMLGTQEAVLLLGTFTRYDLNEMWKFTGGLSTVERSHKEREAVVSFKAEWVGLPSIAL